MEKKTATPGKKRTEAKAKPQRSGETKAGRERKTEKSGGVVHPMTAVAVATMIPIQTIHPEMIEEAGNGNEGGKKGGNEKENRPSAAAPRDAGRSLGEKLIAIAKGNGERSGGGGRKKPRLRLRAERNHRVERATVPI